MKIGIPQEAHAEEKRVACTPDEAARIIALGHSVLVEADAGARAGAGFSDAEYQEAGATIVNDANELWTQADVICKVRPPAHHPALQRHEADFLTTGKTFIGFFHPAQNPDLLRRIAGQGATLLGMDTIPRISRAQNMDALSSMANIAGYRAVLEAGWHFGRFFTGQITAAGKIPPAQVMVVGAGVAGLSAIGAAVSLGAVVLAFDTRPEVREQIESMNAEFLALDFAEDGSGEGGYGKLMSEEFIAAERALIAVQSRKVDIIITTALAPGQPAPKLITGEMVAFMKRGSVIVDLAAEQGGNCELTEAGKVVVRHGVTIVGHTDLPGRMAAQASELYAANLRHLISALTPGKDGEWVVDMEDQVIRGATLAHAGEVTWPPPPVAVSAPTSPSSGDAKQSGRSADSAVGKVGKDSGKEKAEATAQASRAEQAAQTTARRRARFSLAGLFVGGAAIIAAGAVAPPSFLNHFIVFVLACFTGWQVVWRVTPALHTPLMSVTNAISSIIIIGALLHTGSPDWRWLALLAVLLASVNIAGGFLVTQRMLRMFRK